MLPTEVNAEGIEAKMNDGVLTVRVPKREQARRRIKVAAS
jgi:HSP20 family molecular chaperone IbpA